jgi:hypothetical protein
MTDKFLFLIGSAVNHFQEERYSEFSQKERFEQTLKTINSVKEKDPDAIICIYESSSTKIDDKYEDQFKDISDIYINLSNDPGIRVLYQNLERSPDKFPFGKSLLECRSLIVVLNEIKNHNLFTNIRRIFKLSGRYKLNENFDINDYKSRFLINYYIGKVYEYNQERFEDQDNLNTYLYGFKGQLVTGLWSFDKLLLHNTIMSLYNSFEYMEKSIQYTSGTDIEHTLYNFLDKNKIVNIPVLGLDVIKGMNGDRYSL